jgi:molybdopterin-guanine dinucleotide biosynthesis protein A
LRHDGYFRTLGAPDSLIFSRSQSLGKVTFVSAQRLSVYYREMGTASAPDATAFILAGGKSTRMGKDKAFVEVEGRTLLDRALDIAGSVTSDVRIVGSRVNFASFAPVVEDIFRDCGPLGGIHAALLASHAELNLMLAVDTPFISTEFLQYLIDQARIATDAIVTFPSSQGRSQPLCAIYRREFAVVAENALRASNYKIDRLFGMVPACLIDEKQLHAAGFSASLFRNLNTPQELEIEKGRA